MRFLPFCALLCFSLSAAALDAPAKPGLWETVLKNRQIETAVDQTIARFGKNKAPEPQSGAVSTSNSSAGLIEKVCVTHEALKTVGLPAPIRGDCDYKTRWAGNVATIQTFCNGVVTSGEVNYSSGGAYTGWILPSAPWGMGRIEISGRWLGTECGAVKP